jgi:hypothetical protein
MNRYSLLFAAIVAASFVAPTTRTGDAPQATQQARIPHSSKHAGANPGQDNTYGVDPYRDLDEFLQKRLVQTPANSKKSPAVEEPTVLFATVPHPVETHLAADFDENVSALQQGIQDAGYTFDTAWIPWEVPQTYDAFDDVTIEKQARLYQDDFPGILLFRKGAPDALTQASKLFDTYGQGLIVFLIAEKPTAGLAKIQVENALKILTSRQIHLTNPIRILGPTYTGSLPSLEPVVKMLHASNDRAGFLIRSGGVSGGEPLVQEIKLIAAEMPNAEIDFGTTYLNYSHWTDLALDRLQLMALSRGM